MEARLEEGMSVEAAVEAELRALFGADLAGVHLVRDTSSLVSDASLDADQTLIVRP